MSTVHEVCSCGATFDYTSTGYRNPDAHCWVAAAAWRRDHHHNPPPEPEPEQHDSTLDALTERAGNERDQAAELDQRPRLGYRP